MLWNSALICIPSWWIAITSAWLLVREYIWVKSAAAKELGLQVPSHSHQFGNQWLSRSMICSIPSRPPMSYHRILQWKIRTRWWQYVGEATKKAVIHGLLSQQSSCAKLVGDETFYAFQRQGRVQWCSLRSDFITASWFNILRSTPWNSTCMPIFKLIQSNWQHHLTKFE